MALAFEYELSTRETPAEAQARLQRALADGLRRPSGGGGARNLHREMKLSRHTATSLTYKPKLVAPLPVSTMVWLRRLFSAERIDVAFAPIEGDSQTRVTVSGKVGRGAEMIADREFWTELLSMS